MKLEYKKIDCRNGEYLFPEGCISSYQEIKNFFNNLFVNPKLVTDIEIADRGLSESRIRAIFLHGPFHTACIKFEIKSNYHKQFEINKLLMSIMGCLYNSPFFIYVNDKGEIKIDKQPEFKY